jgi:ABC-type multidrug transport system fused ATPase/permease subunit
MDVAAGDIAFPTLMIPIKSPEPFIHHLGETTTPIKSICKYANKRCYQLTFAMIMMVASLSTNILTPMLLGDVLKFIGKLDWESVNDICIEIGFITVASAVASGLKGIILYYSSTGISRDIKYDLVHGILRKDVAFFDSHKTGDLLSRIAADVTVIQSTLTTNVSMVLRGVITILASGVLMVILSW